MEDMGELVGHLEEFSKNAENAFSEKDIADVRERWPEMLEANKVSISDFLFYRVDKNRWLPSGVVLEISKTADDYLKSRVEEADKEEADKEIRYVLVLGSLFRTDELASEKVFRGKPIVLGEISRYAKREKLSIKQAIPIYCKESGLDDDRLIQFFEYVFQRYMPSDFTGKPKQELEVLAAA